jgi:hypothetical protein
VKISVARLSGFCGVNRHVFPLHKNAVRAFILPICQASRLDFHIILSFSYHGVHRTRPLPEILFAKLFRVSLFLEKMILTAILSGFPVRRMKSYLKLIGTPDPTGLNLPF